MLSHRFVGSRCDTVGRVVVSDIIDLQFESRRATKVLDGNLDRKGENKQVENVSF